MNGQANLHGAEMFKWVNIGLRATSTRMGWGVEKKCGESPANRLRSMWMGTQPQGGGVAAGWALGALHAIPGPFPTADSAPPSLSHPQRSHTTPNTQPHPTATLLHQLPSTSLPHPPHVQQRKSFTFASQLCRSFSGTITPLGGRDQKQIPFLCWNLPHAPAPTARQHRLAGGQKGCLSVTLESTATTKEGSAVWLKGLRIAECMAHPVVSTQGHRGPER